MIRTTAIPLVFLWFASTLVARENLRFENDWRFRVGEVAGAERPDFDDAGWRVLDVPHDWSIEDLAPPTNQPPTLALEANGWKFARGDDATWSATGFDDTTWQPVQLPVSFHSLGYTNEPCFGWFRSAINVPTQLRGKDFLLKIGVVDDADETFFNGQKIGGIGGMPPNYDGSKSPWTKPRIYRVPAELVRDGANVVAVRVFNHGADGGIVSLLPHFAAVGPFSPESEGGSATGYTVGGIGWYRKHFTLDAASTGKLVSILFDGVYMNSDVWLNGQHLGNHPYGYTDFGYDLTPFLKPAGQENILVVRVRNLGKNSRWYSGSGIYRAVTLTITDPLHIPARGIYITTPQVAKKQATIKVVTTVENSRPAESVIKLRAKLFSPTGRLLQTREISKHIAASERLEIPLEFEINSPALWSTDSPKLYRAEVEVRSGGEVADQTTTDFGIRQIHFSAEAGFTLNGESVKLRGACLHHDNGPLGSAAIERAEERRVELLKAQGFNAIRTSHNPPSSAFLDACDRLGMLVMDEAFDCWETGKNPDDYSRYFSEWWQRDLDAMILRDRNHPCVVLWSIGNEIPQRADARGYVIAKQLSDEVHRLDPTRPVTEAISNFWDQKGRTWPETATAFSFLDVGGYNYEPLKYETDHEKFPRRIMVGTESYPRAIGDCWKLVEKNSFVLGDYVWTGMDYLGESAIGHTSLDNEPVDFGSNWPWFDAFCGDLDICGFKKPQSFYRDVVWSRSHLEIEVHAPLPPGRTERISDWGWPNELPSWTWPGAEGKLMNVAVYSSCDTVRLELNGRIIATQNIAPENKMTAHFVAPYEPGELKAVGLVNGKIVANKTLRTGGEAKRIRLVADRNKISASREDLAYVTLEIADAAGNILPDASVPVRFSVSGAGELAAVGSGSPNRPESFRGPVRTTFHGRALAILRPFGSPGKIKLIAEAKGFKSETLEILVR